MTRRRRGVDGDGRGRSGRSLARRSTALGAAATVVGNLAGAVVVFVLLAFVLPAPDIPDRSRVVLSNLVLAVGYAGVAAVVGMTLGLRDARRRLRWLVEERPAEPLERRRTVRIPLSTTLRQLALWTLAAGLFALANAPVSVLLAVEIGITVLIGGLTTSATTYLLLERTARPLVARAFVDTPLRRRPGAGVAWKTVLTWGLGTGLPVVGLTLLSGVALGLDVPRRELALAVFVLGLTALTTGVISITIVARAIADPLRGLRHALRRVEEGDFEVHVVVSDTTEVGVLQSGVNRMVEGLRERERIRDLFGRHVGQDVARRALVEGVALGGVERHVAALFVDVQQSTALARRHPPAEVLGLLNAFFAVVVDVVDAHGGLVNKFLGDAALAVWNAPLDHPDPEGAALAAGRVLGRRLPVEVPGLTAGVGIAAGRVVAGNLGTDQRLEYTVIGDPVNVAARLSSRAKQHAGGVVADMAVVEAADEEEQRCWRAGGEEVLRGRDVPTRLAVPADG